MKGLSDERAIEKLKVLQYLSEELGYFHNWACPDPILYIVGTFLKVIKLAFMSINELFVNGKHDLYNKSEVRCLNSYIL